MASDGDVLEKVESFRADVVALIREKRYEEALVALYRARSEAPTDRQLQKSIDQVKEFLVGAYAKRLGSLDRVATPIPQPAMRSPDVMLVARYIDGASTLGDIAHMCPLGQLRTLQVLVGLYCGVEPPRIDVDPPQSGLRMPDGPANTPVMAAVAAVTHDDDTRAPDTARSAHVAAVASAVADHGRLRPSTTDDAPHALELDDAPRPVESEDTRRYNETFAIGTTAFVQGRYAEAATAFEACARQRPGDRAADVMLRRSLREVESR